MENMLNTVPNPAVSNPEELFSRHLDPHARVFIETQHYTAKTVDALGELEQALRLRANIFKAEFGANLGNTEYDIDRYDFWADHLVIVCKKTNAIVGTYRLICSSFAPHFYSESEFQMEDFLKTPGTKLELGRACVHPEHRKGAVLNLLWRAVVQYAFQVKAKYLFGCSSIPTTNPNEVAALIESLRTQGAITQDWKISAQPKYACDPNESIGVTEEAEHLTRGDTPHPIALPPLVRSYLKAGAKVIPVGAVDRDFNCTDLLTVLKLSDLSEAHGARYQTAQDT